MDIIASRKIFYIFSSLVILAGILSLGFLGLKTGIDFNGGSLMEVEFTHSRPETPVIKNKLASLGLGGIDVQSTGERGVILRLKSIDEQAHQEILENLSSLDGIIEKRFDSIGPVIGGELKRTAFWATILALGGIILYIAFAFRKVSKPVASWKYGLCALVALFHDVFIPLALFALLGHFLGVEIDLYFVVALLTILGYSVNDTIVVFDRVRENLKRGLGEDFSATVNLSIKQTFIRSINTSLTTLFVLLAIFFFGGVTTKYFALALIVGIVAGTYSSIFIATSLLVTWEKWRLKRI